MGVPLSAMSAHLPMLTRAEPIDAKGQSRSVVHRARRCDEGSTTRQWRKPGCLVGHQFTSTDINLMPIQLPEGAVALELATSDDEPLASSAELFAHSARSYQFREWRTIRTTVSMTGTSTSTPTTVASAAPD